MAPAPSFPLPDQRPASRWLVLAILCGGVYLINASTTLMNVSLPTLVTALDANTIQLLWIVASFNITFAAVVLAAGGLSDRFGRQRALLVGLVVFGIAATAGSFSDGPGLLIAWRAVMGIGAAIIFPTTLSIIANVFPDRRERAQAIGIWGATTGIAIATGPIGGGFLLEHFWWGSTMGALAPVALVVAILVGAFVPDSRNPAAPRLDWAGLILSTALLGTLVYTIIEAPEAGWMSPRTLTGFAVSAVFLAAFVLAERATDHPLLEVRLFANPRFSATSAAVTLSFFCLFGFIFLVTQYFQFLKGYSPLETGVRLLPVAFSIAVASLLGTRLAVALGTRVAVATGLACLSVAFFWISRSDLATSYPEIVGQMLVLGVGMGLTSAPATEAIMGVVPKEQAGIGSAVNDATRELGGTIGVAVIGSVFASVYQARLANVPVAIGLPDAVVVRAQDSVGAALTAAGELGATGQPALAGQLVTLATNGFLDGFAVGCTVAAAVALVGVLVAGLFVPAHPAAKPVGDMAPTEPRVGTAAVGSIPSGE